MIKMDMKFLYKQAIEHILETRDTTAFHQGINKVLMDFTEGYNATITKENCSLVESFKWLTIFNEVFNGLSIKVNQTPHIDFQPCISENLFLNHCKAHNSDINLLYPIIGVTDKARLN